MTFNTRDETLITGFALVFSISDIIKLKASVVER